MELTIYLKSPAKPTPFLSTSNLKNIAIFSDEALVYVHK